jgi:hypothetical protein
MSDCLLEREAIILFPFAPHLATREKQMIARKASDLILSHF